MVKIATRYFNKFIRERDKELNFFICISCGVRKSLTQLQAGHYFSAGKHPTVRFDEDNVHGQCIKCNYYEHGNLERYKPNLIRKIGQERYNELEKKVSIERHYGFKWDRFNLIEIIEKYKSKNK